VTKKEFKSNREFLVTYSSCCINHSANWSRLTALQTVIDVTDQRRDFSLYVLFEHNSIGSYKSCRFV